MYIKVVNVEEITATEIRKNVSDVLNKVMYQERHIAITRRDHIDVVVVPWQWYQKAIAALEKAATSHENQ